MIDLGFRAHDFGRFSSMSALVDTVTAFRKDACLHFAPYKALDDAPRPLSTSWADAIASCLKDTRIAILGCYINPVHPDPCKKKQALQSFENCLEIAPFLANHKANSGCSKGCSINEDRPFPIVATETGSLDPRNIRTEKNWEPSNIKDFLKTMERLLKKAEENNVTMAIEAVADKNTIDTPQRMLMIMETFKSPHLRVLFDAVNILPIHGPSTSLHSYFDEAVAMLSPYICAMHIKDFVWTEKNEKYPYAKGPVKKGDVPVGEGLMPWKDLFGIYRRYGVDKVPMTLENFNPMTLAKSIQYVEDCFGM